MNTCDDCGTYWDGHGYICNVCQQTRMIAYNRAEDRFLAMSPDARKAFIADTKDKKAREQKAEADAWLAGEPARIAEKKQYELIDNLWAIFGFTVIFLVCYPFNWLLPRIVWWFIKLGWCFSFGWFTGTCGVLF